VLDTTVPRWKAFPPPTVGLDELEVVARQAKVYSILRHSDIVMSLRFYTGYLEVEVWKGLERLTE
jgi:hypothetical protein